MMQGGGMQGVGVRKRVCDLVFGLANEMIGAVKAKARVLQKVSKFPRGNDRVLVCAYDYLV